MNWSIDFAPLLPPPLLWLLVVVAAALVGLLLWRRSRGAWLRFAALAAMLAALFNPTLREEERETLANVAIVVLDESTSQKLSARPEQTAAIKSDLEAKFAKIPNLQIKWVTGAKPSDTAAAGTNLFA
ncbi:MAG: hypothetical protein ABL893_19460, partial [Hyphomicrobium sp.]